MPRVKVKLSGKVDSRYPWMNEEMRQLFVDMTELENAAEIAEFLRDLLTNDEIRMVAQRWHIARLIWDGKDTYAEIAEKIQTSVTTITRVAYRVWYGGGGFERVLKRVLPTKRSKEELEEEELREIETRSRRMPRGSKFANRLF